AGAARLYGPFIATPDRSRLPRTARFRIRRIAPPRLATGSNFLQHGCAALQPSLDFPLAPLREPATVRRASRVTTFRSALSSYHTGAVRATAPPWPRRADGCSHG